MAVTTGNVAACAHQWHRDAACLWRCVRCALVLRGIQTGGQLADALKRREGR